MVEGFCRPARQKIAGIIGLFQDFLTWQGGKISNKAAFNGCEYRFLEGIAFEPSLSASDAIESFCRKETAMCFCWNASMEVQQTINNPDLDFEVFPIAFPTSEDAPKLQGVSGILVFLAMAAKSGSGPRKPSSVILRRMTPHIEGRY